MIEAPELPPLAPDRARAILDAMAATHVVVVGDAMLDHFMIGRVSRISPEAPVPVVEFLREFSLPGGAANVACNVRALGARVSLVAVVGDDPQAAEMRGLLEARGVGVSGLVTDGARPTTRKTRIATTRNQQVARIDIERSDDLAAGVETALVGVIDEATATAGAIVVSDYLKGVVTERVMRHVVATARARGIPVLVDPKVPHMPLYAGATLLTPNQHEAESASHVRIRTADDARRASRALRETLRVEGVLVTLGEQGMAFVSAEESDVIPTQARQVYDVTGAGDSVVAALSVALGRGISMRRACLLANAAAGLQVARVGTSRVTWGEMLAALDGQPPTADGKVVSRSELREAVRRARAEGRRIGFTNGCFDILHHGHVRLLEAAAKECDLLVVGVNSDASVTRLKGPPRPFVGSADRQTVLAGLASVALVCEFVEDTPLEIIREVEPDVLVKGGDYKPEQIVGAEIVLARGGRVVTPLFVPDASTTEIVERVRRSRGGDPGEAARPSGAPSRP